VKKKQNPDIISIKINRSYYMKHLFFSLLFFICLVACKPPLKGKNGEVYKSAVDYNNYIISKQNILVQKMMDVKEVADKNLDSAGIVLDKDVAEIDGMITDIKGMPAYNGDSTFRNAAVDVFIFYKKVFGNEYKQILDIRRQDDSLTTENSDALNKIVESISHQEEKYDKAFHNAQKIFAEANNMRLEENHLQNKIDKE
jgi:hypothetical protein